MDQVIKIPCQLQIEPELCFHTKELLKAKCRIRSNPPLAMDQLINARV